MLLLCRGKWRFFALFLLVCSCAREKVSAQEIEDPTSSGDSENYTINSYSEEGSVVDLSEEDEGPKGSINYFNYKDHSEDHGLYSGRALSSTKNLRLNDEDADEDLGGHKSEDKISDHENAQLKKNKHKFDDDLDSPLNTIDYAEKEWQLMFRALDLASDSVTNPILQEIGKRTNLFEEIVSRLPPACRRDIYHIRESIRKHRLWALRLLDSFGKIPSGVTYGRFSSPGDYEECLRVNIDEQVYRGKTKNNSNILENHKFHGKYCLIDFRLPLPEKPRNKLLSIHESVLNFTGTELERQYPEFVKNYSSYASVFYEIGYMHAFCLPSTCQVEDLTRSLGKTLEGMFIIVNNTVDCEEWPQEGEPMRISQVISLFLIAVVFINAFSASVACYILSKKNHKSKDDGKKKEQNNVVNQWLSQLAFKNKFYSDCFSIQKNFERLSKPDPRGLTFVHYTRIIAMALTVITHTGAMGTLQAITKPADTSNNEQIFRDFLPQMLTNAFTSIQIFFFMAGFMLVVSTYPAIRRDKGRLSFLEYAVKRAIRLMPGIAATICVNFIWPLFVDGPMLRYFVQKIVMPCETNWWHTLGFMSNFDDVEKMCLRHSYFSASDYQLHILAFPLLLVLYKQPALALLLAALLTVCGFVAQVIMILTKNVLPFMMVDYLDKEAFFNVVHYIHHPSWNHMSAFFYGFIIGYLVVKRIRINLSDVAIKRVWITLMPIGVLSIFAPYYWNHYKRPIHKWQMVLYVIFDRFILLTTCAWLSYASMVLARPQSKTKSKSGEGEAQMQLNCERPIVSNPPVPIIIQAPPSPQDESKVKKDLSESYTSKISAGKPHNETPTIERHSPLAGQADQRHLTMSLRPIFPGSSLPRQQSSPNFINLQSGLTLGIDSSSSSLRKLHRTTSGSSLATITEFGGLADAKKQTNDGDADKTLGQVNLALSNTGLSKPSQGLQLNSASQKRRPSRAQVSNVNTLCLILSRLTFQLYLFNMVVLWIDVNHSKYYWFFSYYFVIVKAAAVYIASALMAMIFFVVLESPCLTLYIAWVRRRAASQTKTMDTVAPTVVIEPQTGDSGPRSSHRVK